MSHGVVSHCHRHVSRCGQSLPQTCLTVWSLPQTCLTVWSVTATDISHGVVTATDMSHGVVSHCSHSSSVGSSVRPPRLSLPLTDWLFSLISRLSSNSFTPSISLRSSVLDTRLFQIRPHTRELLAFEIRKSSKYCVTLSNPFSQNSSDQRFLSCISQKVLQSRTKSLTSATRLLPSTLSKLL